MEQGEVIHFAQFTLNPSTGELWKRGQKVKLSPKPLQMLTLLVKSPGELVTRETMRTHLWGDDVFVDFEHGLNFCVREIRMALGDRAKSPKYIETLPKRGYRFIASATEQRAPVDPRDQVKLRAFDYYERAKQAFRSVEKGGLEVARQNYEQALSLDPSYALAHAGLGATLIMRNIHRRNPEDLLKARGHLEKALALDRELAEPYPWLCHLLMRLGDFDGGIRAGIKAVELQPELVHAHYFLGLAYFARTELQSDDYDHAVRCLLNAAKTGPHWQPTYFVLAYCALLNGDYDAANRFGQQLDAAKRISPGLPFIGMELLLAECTLRRGCTEEAASMLQAFLAQPPLLDHMYIDSMLAVAAFQLGDAQLRLGRPDQALKSFRRAWHITQEQPRMIAVARLIARAQAGLARAYWASSEPAQATEMLERARRSLIESVDSIHSAAGAHLAELFYSFAITNASMGNKAEALALLNRAVDAGWRDVAWLDTDDQLTALRSDARFTQTVQRARRAAPLVFND